MERLWKTATHRLGIIYNLISQKITYEEYLLNDKSMYQKEKKPWWKF